MKIRTAAARAAKKPMPKQNKIKKATSNYKPKTNKNVC